MYRNVTVSTLEEVKQSARGPQDGKISFIVDAHASVETYKLIMDNIAEANRNLGRTDILRDFRKPPYNPVIRINEAGEFKEKFKEHGTNWEMELPNDLARGVKDRLLMLAETNEVKKYVPPVDPTEPTWDE